MKSNEIEHTRCAVNLSMFKLYTVFLKTEGKKVLAYASLVIR